MKFALLPKDHPVLGAWIFGLIIGMALGYFDITPFLSIGRVWYEPMPHQIAKYPGGISLRFAMVHDVIHERFPLHGEAYYRRRNALAKVLLEKNSPPTTRTSENNWRLMDDLAVGCVHLGEFDQAISVMRNKLARQEKEGISGAALYSTYANLGTAMMIDALVKGSAGKDSSEELRESLTWVRKSIEVNPQAHFGREVWQVALGEFLLDAAKDPKLLGEFDFIGNTLEGLLFVRPRAIDGRPETVGKITRAMLARSNLSNEVRAHARSWIAEVGADRTGNEHTHTSNPKPVPFDEPVLGIIGMWRYGGGANPFFSLSLAETMRRVGQPHLAWAAYERTTMLLSGLPDKEQAKKLAEHCGERQEEIERTLKENPADLRAAFNADLKAGLEYQGDYQKYEAERIAKGDSIDDPHFYDAFVAEHGEISSDPGDADLFKFVDNDLVSKGIGPGLLAGGGASLITAFYLRRLKGRKA